MTTAHEDDSESRLAAQREECRDGCCAMHTVTTARTTRAMRGITLIELMIAVVIIGILAGIAYPAYQDHVRKSRRSDGKAALQTLATRLEQYYLDNKQYTSTLSSLGYTAVGGTYYSPESYYALAVTTSTASCPATSCYELTATAQAKGNQNNDTACYKLTLNSTGTKGSQNSGGTTTSGCW